MIRIDKVYKAIKPAQFTTKKGNKFTVFSLFDGTYNKETKESNGTFYKIVNWLGTLINPGDGVKITKIIDVSIKTWTDKVGGEHKDIQLNCEIENCGKFEYPEKKEQQTIDIDKKEVFDAKAVQTTILEPITDELPF